MGGYPFVLFVSGAAADRETLPLCDETALKVYILSYLYMCNFFYCMWMSYTHPYVNLALRACVRARTTRAQVGTYHTLSAPGRS